MADPAIRAALEAAARAYCHADGECPCATPVECRMVLAEVRLDTAAAIAAFLRALPASYDLTRFDHLTGKLRRLSCDELHHLAAAVEEAARDA